MPPASRSIHHRPLFYIGGPPTAGGPSAPAAWRSLLTWALLLGSALATTFWPPELNAQGSQSAAATAEARRLVQDALALAERGDTTQAIDRAARASRLAPDLADARFLHGLLLARTAGTGLAIGGRRTDASREFEAALRLDAGNPRYLVEIARLRMKHPLFRLMAERYFRRARDAARSRGDPSLEAEVEAEIGFIYFRRYEALANRRILTGPVMGFDWESALRDPHYTHDLLQDQSSPVPGIGETDLARAELHFRAGVAADAASEAANRGLLNLLNQTDRREEYLDAAATFARAAPANAVAQLYLGLALWRTRRGAAADSAFTRAQAGLPPAERDRLVDLAPILRARDAVAYHQMADSERAGFQRLDWWMTEPLRLTAEHEYRLEHLSRVAEADLRFSAPDLRLRGWHTDRGQIYIRYGPPPVIATFPPNPYEVNEGDLATGMLTTVWFYPRRNLRFVFNGPPAYNYQRLAGDFSSYVEDLRSLQPVAYDNVPVTLAIDSIPVQVAQFRSAGDTAGTDVVFFAGIPVRDMVREVDLQRGDLETGLFLSDTAMHDRVTRRATEAVMFRAEGQFERRTETVRLPPGAYLYRFEARLPDAERAARGAAPLAVEDFGAPTLALSDIVVADRVAPREEGGPQRGRHDFFLVPNPAMRFGRTDPVHLYAEAYHLSAGPPGAGGPAGNRVGQLQVAVRLRIESLERTSIAARVIGGVLDAVGASATGDEQITLSYISQELLDGRDRVPIYLALDLAGAPAGRYQLDLAVKDLTTNQLAVRHRRLLIVEPTQ